MYLNLTIDHICSFCKRIETNVVRQRLVGNQAQFAIWKGLEKILKRLELPTAGLIYLCSNNLHCIIFN